MKLDRAPFADWVQAFEPAVETGCWCHVTDAYALRGIIQNNGRLSPQDCSVFTGDKLTYLFLGRPAYRLNAKDGIIGTAKAPVVLLFHQEVEKNAKRIFPFDSGAFSRGRYSQWMHPRMRVEDFDMSGIEFAAARQVRAFFQTFERYLICDSREVSYSPGEFEVESYAAMLKEPGISFADDRRVAIELQIAQEISLKDGLLAGIVVPEAFRDAEYFQEFLAELGGGVKILDYPTKKVGAHQQEFVALLEDRTTSLQVEIKAGH